MPRRYDDNPLMNENNQGPNWKKVLGISLCIILAIVLIGGGVIYYVGHNLFNLSNYVADEDVQKVDEIPAEVQEIETEAPVVLNESELNNIHERMSSVSSVETKTDEDVYNLLLVGVDRRDKG